MTCQHLAVGEHGLLLSISPAPSRVAIFSLDDKLAAEGGREGSGSQAEESVSRECVLRVLAWELLGGCRILSCTWPWSICWHMTWSFFFCRSTDYSFRGLGSSRMGAGDDTRRVRCGAWRLGRESRVG